jgi:hypothetical protein
LIGRPRGGVVYPVKIVKLSHEYSHSRFGDGTKYQM